MAPKPKPPIVRFNNQTRPGQGGCIEWTGDVGNSGYGRFWIGPGKADKALAHRWSYEYHVGPIPEGLVIDHLCRNKLCSNPAHLEPVTMAENWRRGTGPGVLAEKLALPQRTAHTGTSLRKITPPSVARSASTGFASPVPSPSARQRRSTKPTAKGAIEKARQWRLENPERYREINRESQRRYRARKKEEANGLV